MKNSLLNRFSNLILLLLSILPLTALIIHSFSLIADRSFMLWAGALCLFMWLAANFRRGLVPGLLLSGLLLFFAYRHFSPDVRMELTDFFDRITGVYYEHYFAVDSQYPFENAVDSHTFILLAIIFLLAAYMSMSLTSKTGRISFSLLGSLPVFAGCAAVNGRPSVAIVLCLMLFWALLLIGGNYYSADSNQGRSVLLTALPITAMLCALVLWQRPSEYDYTAAPTDFVERFDKLGTALTSWVDGLQGGTGLFSGEGETARTPDYTESPFSKANYPGSSWGMGDGALDMGINAQTIDRKKLVLRARAETDGYMYLRSFSYGDYTGTGWLRAEEPEAGSSSLAFTAQAIQSCGESREHILDVRFNANADVMAIPYYSTQSAGSDVFVSSNGGRNYSVGYYSFEGSFSDLSLPEEYVQGEALYRSYAHSRYTALPESTKADILYLIRQAGISADSPDVIFDVAHYVKNRAAYDINTLPYPSDDYAVYFLEQAQTGYCIHYATAATVIYRALGIPARVADGFLFRAEAGEFVDVLQANEHAWVEVYMDGLGWIPVEVTGSAGATEEPIQESETPEPSEPALTPPQESSDPTDTEETPPPVQWPRLSDSLPVGIITSQPKEDGHSTSRTLIRVLDALLLALLLLFVLSILPVVRLLRLKLMRSRIAQPDRQKAAVWVWKYASKVSKFSTKIPDTITICAEKAAFSQHGISETELRNVQNELLEMIDGCFNSLSGIKKLIFKFLFALK